MPRGKNSKAPQTAARRPPAINGTEVLTLAEAAAYLRLSEPEVVDLVHSQNLPGRFTGREWRFLKAAISKWLAAGAPNEEARKAAQLALAGKYKNDPDLLRICEDAYKERGRLISGDD